MHQIVDCGKMIANGSFNVPHFWFPQSRRGQRYSFIADGSIDEMNERFPVATNVHGTLAPFDLQSEPRLS